MSRSASNYPARYGAELERMIMEMVPSALFAADRHEKGMHNCDTQTLIDEIGPMNILAISGGRIYSRKTGITLPVFGSDYSVTVDLAANGTYTVRRIFVRAKKRFVKGEMTDVCSEDVGDVAYDASCYANSSFPLNIEED